MFEPLISFHRFLGSQSFYPIVFSSIMAIGFYIGRVLYGQNWNYGNLVWNLILAWVPYSLSLIAVIVHRLYSRGWWLILPLGASWLIFFPNAPYLVTDFLHLEKLPSIPLWYDIGMLATFAWTGCFLAIASLRTMQYLVKKYAGWLVSWLFASFALGLGGLGIYLGRFGRFNSWDLILNPKEILKLIAIRMINPFDNLGFFGFTMMFTAILVCCYLMFISIRHIDEQEKQL